MKKSLRILVVLSIAASSVIFSPTALAIGAPYDGTSGDVLCGDSGYFTISNNVVTRNASCQGSVNIPSGVSSLAERSFYAAINITTLVIPTSVRTIGDYAFSDLGSLTTLTIPVGVTSIGYNAFNNARLITALVIPNSVTSIGGQAFAGARALTTLTIPDSVTSLGSYAFIVMMGSSPLTSYEYCGTTLTPTNFSNASLGGKTKICPSSVTVPGAPTSVSAALTGATTVNVSFTAPTSDGGATITSYTATSSPGVNTGSISQAGSGTITMTGLTAGTSYTFIVTATNSAGTGSASSASNSITTVGAPESPMTVSVTTGKRSAKVRFSAPASNGGSAITSYTTTSSPGGFTQTINQSEGGMFYFEGLEPNTFYTFAVTATNAIGTSAPAVSLASKTEALVVASMSELTFQDNGTGTAGKIIWTGMNIDAVLYTGDPAFYPGPFNYGAFTGGWNGQVRNLTPSTSYTVSINAISSDGVGVSKSLTFKTNAAPLVQAGYQLDPNTKAEQSSNNFLNVFKWVDENIHDTWEVGSLKTVLDKFNRLDASKSSAYLQMPYSRVLSISAYSFTPMVCLAGGIGNVIISRKAGTCTIAFTVYGPSRAPVTLIKDMVFNKFTNW